ncbi:bifunctional phosphoribosyl-AMP cyclohydrolase/phosphoribosyl-ATP pyrophosphohydrolase [Thermococcus onnurineus NA1]|uniref:Histidine biosynthesis bifunctional protein HisIE n=1 Tax=Thermococcus onnurineus (strain NA1) TaxID=523850 RepID=B6YWB0_THEON|nr:MULTISPECIES: bifunctional phosphoribosyl-AMP cyclohydrolase/phosphoribosyl-ATP diphosphatase HisIE [Thermococcus]ACJ16373.1 bifunctional phosphoribosyl-AMP cyclohydrolase/phosphoribosyl-ATP pyrophosphohydrolase [Thermococcus onnurineus NA1]NJE47722.1 bifunctional phosphoribosyl-AMP cyclohydrolase/phosphoribosyl-ATP diphosphatase HisIE [Thermococcus sp. GR7]NJE79097.1 bifunctional phosphoribosyl-AMP cyclohydrolase/phosphoribosyl-ATP diphosphatase HisIE [Thermococcus sp. GR4]NJF22514.1 bifunc
MDELINRVNWEKNGGIVPVIVQDTRGEVLTLAYMSREALRKTLETGYAHYYSRSQDRIRMKGEVSGNVQLVKEVRVDCDNDALLLIVEPKGPACHTGNYSCFYRKLGEPERIAEEIDYSLTILRELEELIKQRKEKLLDGSYTSKLFAEGKEKIYKKFGEEAIEVLVAEDRERIIYETADMLYHLLVLLAYNDISLGEVMTELRRRRK